jgi:phosphatidyl-myo-inositol alpha-mannosyltransferase
VRIALVTLRFDAPGGVETTVLETARRLRRAGEAVEVFASDLVDEASWTRGTEFRAEVDGVPVRRFPVRKRLLPHLTMPTMIGLIDALAESDPDVVHAHSHRYGHVLEAAAVARGRGIPLVVSTHYHPPNAWEPARTRRLLRVEDVVFGATAYRVARALVVESEVEAALVGEFAPRDRIHVVPPGIDLDEWSADPAEAPNGPDLPPKYLLFAGRVASNKGLPVLLDALARIPPSERLPLVVLGPPWGESAALDERVRQLGLAASVRWLGTVADRSAYRAALRGATALVLPSAWEAFGLVLLDAMAARVPIVATGVGAVPEVLEAGRAGRLVPYGDPDALASAIRAVVSDPETSRQMVERGSERVRSLDWATSVDRLRAIYRAAVG